VTINRRFFTIYSVSLFGSCFSNASKAQTVLSESDPQAMALGYKENAMNVDRGKFPKFSTDQGCYNCALWQGSQTSTSGGCVLFVGKSVSASGWCSAYARKAGYSGSAPPQNYSAPAPQTANPAPQNMRNTSMSIDAAKAQCADLGFKSGTEGFAKCVLQFTK
jgi:hypothetical protein